MRAVIRHKEVGHHIAQSFQRLYVELFGLFSANDGGCHGVGQCGSVGFDSHNFHFLHQHCVGMFSLGQGLC